MFKTITFNLVAALMAASTAQAGFRPQAVAELSNAVDGVQTQDNEFYNCRAWTQCLNGTIIFCHSSGTYSCHSEFQPAQSVYCEARGLDGAFAWVQKTCD